MYIYIIKLINKSMRNRDSVFNVFYLNKEVIITLNYKLLSILIKD